MQNGTESRSVRRRGLGRFLVVGVATAAFVLAAETNGQALAQSVDATDLLESFLQANQGSQTNQTTQTTQTAESEVGTTPLTDTRQTTVTNQFTAATGGAIQLRRPGLWVQQGIAEHSGAMTFSGDVPEETPNFFKSTFDQMNFAFMDVVSGLFTMIDSFISSFRGSGGGSSSGTVFVGPPNGVTTWQGTSQTIP